MWFSTFFMKKNFKIKERLHVGTILKGYDNYLEVAFGSGCKLDDHERSSVKYTIMTESIRS